MSQMPEEVILVPIEVASRAIYEAVSEANDRTEQVSTLLVMLMEGVDRVSQEVDPDSQASQMIRDLMKTFISTINVYTGVADWNDLLNND